MVLYADDANTIFNGKNQNETYHKATAEMFKVNTFSKLCSTNTE